MSKKERKEKPYRGVNDEIRREHQKTKDMTLKGKLSYFWDYYKVHTAAAIVILIIAVSLIYDVVTQKDFIFYNVMLNNTYLSGDLLESSFGEYAGLDMENYECVIDTDATFSYLDNSNFSMANFQKIVALVQARDLDSMIVDSQVCYNFGCNEVVRDLRTVLTEEELKKYEGNIYYIDYAPVRASEESEEKLDELHAIYDKLNAMTIEEAAIESENHRSPEGMAEPIPIGIYMTDAPFNTKTNDYPSYVPIYVFSSTSERIEPAKQYLEYLWDENVTFEEMIVTPF